MPPALTMRPAICFSFDKLMKIFALLTVLLLTLSHVAVADTFFVANEGVNTISQLDENGNASNFTTAFVNGPNGLALDRFGNLFVSTNSNTIEKFSLDGVHLSTFARTGLNFPMALAFDRDGNLYAANFAGGTVEKFTPAGVGTVFANVIRPTGLAFDAAGNLYVATFSQTIERFAPGGTPLGTFAQSGLNNPEGLAFDSLGNLYAANNGANTVEKFSPAGADLGVFVSGLSGPVGLAFDRDDNLYAVNARAASVTKITPSGSASPFATTGFTPAFIAVQSAPLLVNLSTRGRVLTGDKVLDAGFFVKGPGSKEVLIRGLGPSLLNAGVSDALADPILELHDSSGAILVTNDNWRETQESEIVATGIPPTAEAEAAIIRTLAPGAYTVIERGKNEGTGVGLVEIYDLNAGFGADLANLSTRGFVGTESDVLIAGLIVGSQTGGSSEVLVRALGPSLGEMGVSDPLADPVLELHNGDGVLIASNDNWTSSQRDLIEATGIPPNDPVEAALIVTLEPGNYTAIELGKEGGTGVGLVEVFDLSPLP